MKSILKYTSIAIIGMSLVSCGGSKDNKANVLIETQSITAEKALNNALTYGTVYDIDSNAYKTIKIGNYEWFAQNLKVSKLNDGTSMVKASEAKAWNSVKEPAYCSYNNIDTVKANGFLYNHKAVETKKICPQGWEVPSDSAWINLSETLGGNEKAGISLKSTVSWKGQETSNSSGFSALPSGFRESDGSFQIMGENGFWWSANEHNAANAMYNYIDKNTSLNHSHIKRADGLSIRCVKEVK